MMAWQEKEPKVWQMPAGIRIRKMETADLPAVARVDEAAFLPLWQNSLSMLEQAFPQAVIATVAESKTKLSVINSAQAVHTVRIWHAWQLIPKPSDAASPRH
jgi:hypothetical protein